MLQWKTTVERLENTPPSGRLVIHISKDVKRWANTSADIEVRAGDEIYIPKKPGVVMVDGAVFHSTAVSFKPGKNAELVSAAGGRPVEHSQPESDLRNARRRVGRRRRGRHVYRRRGKSAAALPEIRWSCRKKPSVERRTGRPSSRCRRLRRRRRLQRRWAELSDGAGTVTRKTPCGKRQS